MKVTEKISKEIPSLQTLLDRYADGETRQGIKEIQDLVLPRKYPGQKPFLSRTHTTAEAKEYVNKLEHYEKEFASIKAYNESIQQHNQAVIQTVEDFIKEKSGLNSLVPAQYRDKVYSKAYSDGHSNGYSEVYNILLDLVDIFR